MNELYKKVKALADQFEKEVIEIRRHLHQYPELSFQEFETSKYIASKLDEFGISYNAGYVKTGIRAIIEGNNPGSKVIALRADIDALPVTERNDLHFKSKNTGVMHACGHDVHTSCLLGAAKILSHMKDELEGTVLLLFQPAEEKIPGGAKQMIEEGAVENPKPDIVIAQHVMPSMGAGKVGFKEGMYMASADEIFITVKGKGGHAAMPDQINDTVLIASQIIVSLQSVISRSAPPDVPTVLSFGKVIANGAVNIIPDEVRIEGTFRSMCEKWRSTAHVKIAVLAESIAKGMGAGCTVEIAKGYPALVNDLDVTVRARQFAIEYLGEDNVLELEMRMTAEDFAYFTQVCPSTIFRLGTGKSSKGIFAPLHSPDFMVDEKCIKTGTGIMAGLAVEFLCSK